ncbi:MAG TPA: hypothetical protein VFV87_15760 [Pirellulaceae bacterium]|nr:hypothetical protein [Pirellulaceae bacterium]
MAKRRNKASKIRAVLEELGPDAKVAQVVETLAARRVRVRPQQVYAIKAANKNGRSNAGDYNSLVKAKKLADAMGGVEKAKAALDVLAKLM